MIMVKGAELGFKGSAAIILAEYTLLTRELRGVLTEKGGKEWAERQMDNAIKDSKKSMKQIDDEIMEKINKLDSKEALRKLTEAIMEVMKENDR